VPGQKMVEGISGGGGEKECARDSLHAQGHPHLSRRHRKATLQLEQENRLLFCRQREQ
jgi:hypothetical protein